MPESVGLSQTTHGFIMGLTNTLEFIGACHLYKSPKSGATLNSSTPISFEWDPSCLDGTQYVDIALLSARGEIFRWGSIQAASGKHDCQLDAGWWDQQNDVQLQVRLDSIRRNPPPPPFHTPVTFSHLPALRRSSGEITGTRL